MGIEEANRFAEDARRSDALAAALEGAQSTDDLINIAIAHGYALTAEDYYNSGRTRAEAVEQPWPPEEGSAYSHYGYPYSAFPPVPPPMPTYLPPPPYVPPDGFSSSSQ